MNRPSVPPALGPLHSSLGSYGRLYACIQPWTLVWLLCTDGSVISMGAWVSLRDPDFSFLGSIPRSGTAGRCGSSTLSALRNPTLLSIAPAALLFLRNKENQNPTS